MQASHSAPMQVSTAANTSAAWRALGLHSRGCARQELDYSLHAERLRMGLLQSQVCRQIGEELWVGRC